MEIARTTQNCFFSYLAGESIQMMSGPLATKHRLWWSFSEMKAKIFPKMRGARGRSILLDVEYREGNWFFILPRGVHEGAYILALGAGCAGFSNNLSQLNNKEYCNFSTKIFSSIHMRFLNIGNEQSLYMLNLQDKLKSTILLSPSLIKEYIYK